MSEKTQVGVKLVNVTKLYQDPKTKKVFKAVDTANVEIEPGSFVTLLCPSGCGKTTTLRMIAGFESPDEGEIYFGDQAVNHLMPNKRDTAMVFQSYALLPHYNVFNNVAYGLKIRKFSKEEIKQKVTDILELVGLSGMEERMTFQLSGGQQQRVALARALVVEPSVLLFDEPLSNLDAKLRVSMRTEIRKIQQKIGITAIYVTHDQSEAMAISDKIIIMNKGVITQIGTPREIYFYPKNQFVADFIGEANFLDGEIVGSKNGVTAVKVGDTILNVPDDRKYEKGQKCKLVLRPESLSIDSKGALPCKVVLSTFMGSYQYYQADFNGSLIKITEYNPKHRKTYEAGEEAFLAFNNQDLHILTE